MYRNILLAYDGSRDGQEALEQGAALARMSNASVLLLAVVNWLSAVPVEGATLPIDDTEKFEATLEDGLLRLRARGLKSRADLKFGDPAQQIAQSARDMKADLIVLGHRSQSALSRWWNGSVGASVLKHAPCSVLIALTPTIGSDVRDAPPARRKEKVAAVPLVLVPRRRPQSQAQKAKLRPHATEPEG